MDMLKYLAWGVVDRKKKIDSVQWSSIRYKHPAIDEMTRPNQAKSVGLVVGVVFFYYKGVCDV